MSADSNFDLRRAVSDAAIAPEVERRIVEGALRRASGSRRGEWVTRAALVAAAAAAIMLLALWIGAHRHAVERRGGGLATVKQPATKPAEPTVGTVWSTKAEERGWDLGPHRLELAPRSRVRFAAGSAGAPQLEAGQGRSHFAVAPLAATGRRFVVQTKQVKVEVIGTQFTVEVSPHCTLVEVQRGRVRTTTMGGAQRELGAGEQRSFCDPIALDSAGQTVQRAIALAARGESLAESEATLTAYLDLQPRGTYAEEAHYFLVLVKRRLGKEQQAVEQARLFLDRFPSTERAATLRAWLEKNR
jgi:ferric-dicitrate binding protein FerR (iron transport regulator)